MTVVITVNRGSRMATLLRWSTKNIISRSQSQWIKTTPKNKSKLTVVRHNFFSNLTSVYNTFRTIDPKAKKIAPSSFSQQDELSKNIFGKKRYFKFGTPAQIGVQ